MKRHRIKKLSIIVFSLAITMAHCVFTMAAEGALVGKPRLAKETKDYAIYDVTYWSTGLKVEGKVFESRSHKGDLPGIVFNHGGVGGIPGPTVERCKELARAGVYDPDLIHDEHGQRFIRHMSPSDAFVSYAWQVSTCFWGISGSQ